MPAQVTIAVGQDAADVPVTAGREGTATLTANGGGRMESATLTVYGAATPRTVASVTLSATRISRGGQATGTVRLGVPAAVGGTAVSLAVNPAALAMTDVASVTVPEGQLEATFTVIAGSMDGTGSVAATVGMSTRSAPFEVVSSITRAPGPGDLVLTEVHYNPSGTTEEQREWVEIHNPTADTLSLDGVTFSDNQARFTLSGANLTLGPGGYAVLAFNGDMAMNGGVTALAAYGMSAANLRFGNSGDNLRLSLGGTDLDQVQYGAGWPGSNGASMCLRAPYGDNSVAASWSTSVGPFGAGDLGSPGAANDATNCP